MSDTLFSMRSQSMYPYWVNHPPITPCFATPHSLYRLQETSCGMFTGRGTGDKSHQNWTDKWFDKVRPVRPRDELPRLVDRREPISKKWMYQPGTSSVPRWTTQGKDWPTDSQRYLTAGRPPTETTRARAFQRLVPKDITRYLHSTAMTSTCRPVAFSLNGSLQRQPVYGLTHQHNRHGSMPFDDYY